MKYLKILGLVAVAVATMALAGAGAASAETTLCTTSASQCLGAPSGVGAGSREGGGLPKPTFTGQFGPLKCNSEMEWSIETATTPSGKGVDLTWTSCEGGTAVTATFGTVQIHHEKESNGIVTLKDFVVKTVQAGVPCYWSGTVEGTLKAGSGATITFTTSFVKIDTEVHNSSVFCEASLPWHATYQVESPASAYVLTGT